MKDECWHHLGLRGVNAHTKCGDVAVNSFKQALHLSVAYAVNHNVVGSGKVGHMDVGLNRNPWVILKRLSKNSVAYLIEESCAASLIL